MCSRMNMEILKPFREKFLFLVIPTEKDYTGYAGPDSIMLKFSTEDEKRKAMKRILNNLKPLKNTKGNIQKKIKCFPPALNTYLKILL